MQKPARQPRSPRTNKTSPRNGGNKFSPTKTMKKLALDLAPSGSDGGGDPKNYGPPTPASIGLPVYSRLLNSTQSEAITARTDAKERQILDSCEWWRMAATPISSPVFPHLFDHLFTSSRCSPFPPAPTSPLRPL